MIKGHGQYEGGGWPEMAVKGSRILGFNLDFSPRFSVGRQSKIGAEANTGVLFYPMTTFCGPNHSVIVNDQTKQPAQVWTKDGLYVGGFFDHRADDGMPNGFYQVHGDDNQGGTLVTTKEGRTYWLMPYIGQNRLYEITGWNDWHRQSGKIQHSGNPAKATRKGSGLIGRYRAGGQVALETIEAPIYFEPFGREPHGDKIKAPYTVEWSGFLEPPVSDQYQFQSLLGKGESLTVRIAGEVVLSNETSNPINLVAGQKVPVSISYSNPDERAELKLLWRSRITDPQRIDPALLYPAQ